MRFNKKIILISILFLFLYGCGYTPLYTNKENINFNIKSLEIEGDTQINNFIKSNLINYINNGAQYNNYIVKINSKFSKKSLAKDRTGKTTDLKLVAEINIEYKEENSSSNDNSTKIVSFSEDFNIKKNQNNFEQRDYEKSIKKNLSQKLTDKMVRYLILNKWYLKTLK